MKKLLRIGLLAVGCGTAATIGNAAIYYTSESEIFVGKGDYQNACGTNNRDTQTNLSNSSNADWEIRVTGTATYNTTCADLKGNGEVNENKTVAVTKTTPVAGTAGAFFTPKQKNAERQITGIFLALETFDLSVGGVAPKVDEPCTYFNNGTSQPGKLIFVSEPNVTYDPQEVYVDCSHGGETPEWKPVGEIDPAS